MGKISTLGVAMIAVGTVSCAFVGATPSPRNQFWSELQRLCGNAYEGVLVQAPPGDTTFAGKRLTMHVSKCTDDEIRIPVHVGVDRSRTWVLSQPGAGLRLKHDHRHEDGSEDTVTQYGGDSSAPGTADTQEFPADEHTKRLNPAFARNVWTVQVIPGRMFAYALRREGTDRRYRFEFDLTRPVTTPPAAWGSR